MNEIPLESVSLETFQKVLQFVYSGTLHMEGVALQVMCCAYIHNIAKHILCAH